MTGSQVTGVCVWPSLFGSNSVCLLCVLIGSLTPTTQHSADTHRSEFQFLLPNNNRTEEYSQIWKILSAQQPETSRGLFRACDWSEPSSGPCSGPEGWRAGCLLLFVCNGLLLLLLSYNTLLLPPCYCLAPIHPPCCLLTINWSGSWLSDPIFKRTSSEMTRERPRSITWHHLITPSGHQVGSKAPHRRLRKSVSALNTKKWFHKCQFTPETWEDEIKCIWQNKKRSLAGFWTCNPLLPSLTHDAMSYFTSLHFTLLWFILVYFSLLDFTLFCRCF